jgi:hypothetical protein
MDEALQSLAASFVICVLLAVAGFAIRACIVDARRRGRLPLLVLLAVFLCFPLGLILWLLLRPEPSKVRFVVRSEKLPGLSDLLQVSGRNVIGRVL